MPTLYLDDPFATCPCCSRPLTWNVSDGYCSASCDCGWGYSARRAATPRLFIDTWLARFPAFHQTVLTALAGQAAMAPPKADKEQVYLVAIPSHLAVFDRLIDTQAGYFSVRVDEPQVSERLQLHRDMSAEPLTVFRCVKDGGWWKVLDRVKDARVKETVSPLDRYFNPKDDIWKDATVENLPTRGSRGS